MKTIINEGQRGFLFKNGKFVKMLESGCYNALFGRQIIIAEVSDYSVRLDNFDTEIFLRDENFRAQTVGTEVKSGEIALHLVNGVFCDILSAGSYFFWNINRDHTFVCINLSEPEIPEDFPAYLYNHARLSPYILKVEVSEKQKALLYYDKKFVRLLDAGTYYFIKGNVKVETETVETCLQQQEIVGQEILTADKVSLRINCTCSYKIVDYVKVNTETDNYRNQLYTAVQLALRDYIGERRLDEILAGKNEMSAYLLGRIAEKGKSYSLKWKKPR